MSPESATALRTVLDGLWGHVREESRSQLATLGLGLDPALGLDEARDTILAQLRELIATGVPAAGFTVAHGGSGDPGMAVTGVEMLAQFDLSLMVKAGVQWGLFGGAIENLGTARHHRMIPGIIDLSIPGCFAMTETGHGSDVQQLETTGTYDPDTCEFVIDSPTDSARKDYIGGAARHARVAAVFARLITRGQDHGVHCFVVPLRSDTGDDLPGVTTSDCGHKGGLPGVDNGRILFDQVRIPRENLLNRYGDVAADGTYSSPIESPGARFFTMIGTLIRGRVSVGGSASAATEVALTIALRYAVRRRQFEGNPGEETVLLDYLAHQRRLLPLLARSYAYRFAQNQLVARMHRLQTTSDPDPLLQRELESRAAGLKAAQTQHATRTIQECREACGGAGYLAENRLTELKADSDVFTTFEGDNVVLTQLVAKELLTAYAKEVTGLDGPDMVRFVAGAVADTVKERTAASTLIQRLIDARPGASVDHELLDRGTQLSLFEEREQHLLETAARRLRRAAGKDRAAAFAVFNAAQDHVLEVGRAHIDRVVLEAFTAAIARCDDEPAAELLRLVCSVHALSVIEEHKAWFLEHQLLSTERSKAVTTELNRLLGELRPHVPALIEALAVPDAALRAVIAD